MSFSSPETDALEKFPESVLELQQKESTDRSEAKPSLDPDTLRQVAAKYGLDGDAYDQLVKEAGEHRTRGLLFFEHRN